MSNSRDKLNNKDKSLLEIALELFKDKRKPQRLSSIIEEVISMKGGFKNKAIAEEKKIQFIADFMQSGYFIYCGTNEDGDSCWDLKEKQTIKMLDKDDSVMPIESDQDKEAKQAELTDDMTNITSEDKEKDDDDVDDNEEDDALEREVNESDDEAIGADSVFIEELDEENEENFDNEEFQ